VIHSDIPEGISATENGAPTSATYRNQIMTPTIANTATARNASQISRPLASKASRSARRLTDVNGSIPSGNRDG